MSFTFFGKLSVVECCNCHIYFAMPEDLHVELQRNHKSFWCPAGHSISYRQKSDIEIAKAETEEMRRQRDREKQNSAYLHSRIEEEAEKKNHARAQARAFKGVITKVKKRVGNGVCTCCNRSFSNLAAHMKHKHPEWAKGEA
jgi:hypothetical protein